MTAPHQVWKSELLGKQYLTGVRGAIPFADQQMELMLSILGQSCRKPGGFLDLGCGDGVLGRALLARWPDARGVFLDFSETMIAAARRELDSKPWQAAFVLQDYG